METGPAASRGFRGTISLQLTDLIQMVCLSGSDMIIRVRGTDGSGAIHIKDGNIVHAQSPGNQGEPAFFEILFWNDGQFETLPCQDMEVVSIRKPWEHLLLEATRRRDEEADAPHPDPSLLDESQPPARDRRSDEWDAAVDETFRELGWPSPGDKEDEDATIRSIPEPEASRPLRALIVDDSPFFARQLKRLLEHDGEIEVPVMAGNGKEALQALDSGMKFDLMTLDIEMPLMAGDTTLKNIMIRHPIPSVIISNLGSRPFSRAFEFLQLGAVEFLPKPEVHDDITRYGEKLRDLVKRVSKARVRHFKRLRRFKEGSYPDHSHASGFENRILVVLGAEGAHADWLRLPLPRLCALGFVIGLQDLAGRFLQDYGNLLQTGTGAPTRTITGSTVLLPGYVHVGNAHFHVHLTRLPDGETLNVEPHPSRTTTWLEGVSSWVAQLSDLAGDRMSVCILSAAHPMSSDLLLRLLKNKTRILPFRHERVMCTEMVESLRPFLRNHPGLIRWTSPETLAQVWTDPWT